MKPSFYVKANGTVVMTYDVFKAAHSTDIVKALTTTVRRPMTKTTATKKKNREQRDLTIALYVGQR